MKAEFVNRFKYVCNKEARIIHMVFEQDVPILSRNPKTGEVTYDGHEPIEVVALQFNYNFAADLVKELLKVTEEKPSSIKSEDAQ